MKVKIKLSIFLLICTLTSFSQDYIKYHQIFNRIDGDILSNNIENSLLRLDTIEDNYDFVFARHCIKGLQICCFQKDNERTNKWLKKCFVQGVPLWIIRNNEITSSVFNNPKTAEIIDKYDSFNNIYNSRINKSIAKTIDSLYEIDQHKTRRVNDGFFLFRHTVFGLQWLKNNKRQFAVIKAITEKYGFPGEQLIGLPNFYQDSNLYYSFLKNQGPLLSDYRSYIMLIHYYSNPRKDINEILLNNLKKGYIQPNQFGAINDFLAKWGKGKYGKYEFYNVWHHDSDSTNIARITFLRQDIGLSTLDEKHSNEAILLSRRKNQTCNSTIILE